MRRSDPRVNDNINSIFGNTDITVIDEGGPIITNFTPLNSSVVSGNAEFSVMVDDMVGIQSIEFLIDGVHYANYGFLQDLPLKTNATFPFFVPVYQATGTIGAHTLTVKVTNIYGTTREVVNNVEFDNT